MSHTLSVLINKVSKTYYTQSSHHLTSPRNPTFSTSTILAKGDSDATGYYIRPDHSFILYKQTHTTSPTVYLPDNKQMTAHIYFQYDIYLNKQQWHMFSTI